MFFLFKKAIGAMLAPGSMAIVLAMTAGVARGFKRPRLAVSLIVACVVVAYLGSITLVSDALLRPLETAYPKLNEANPPAAVAVVVLGSSYHPRKDWPITAALNSEGLVRAVEGVRLYRALNVPRLVLSGGKATSRAPSAQGYAILARSLGVSPDAITILDQPDDTAQEAIAIRALLGDSPFVLVTSAYHMPRAMRLMKEAGANAIPAPTYQRADESDGTGPHSFIPGSAGLDRTEAALHEYLGLLALRIGVK